MDLNQSVTYRGTELNSTAYSGGVLVGVRVDTFTYGDIELRQFSEPKALADGRYAAMVNIATRRCVMTGTLFDTNRRTAFDRYNVLNDLFLPTAEYIADPASMGYGTLAFYQNGVYKTLSVLSLGMRVTWNRLMFGGNDADPLAIPWRVEFIARTVPAVEGGGG